MGNILEITESRPTVRITEAGNTLQVLAPNAIVITDKKPEITVFESVPQVIVQSAGIQGPIGLNWRGSWDTLLSYLKSDAIHYGGQVYYCIEDVDNPVVPPSSDTTHWDLLLSNSAIGMNWVGAYSSSTAYAVLDAVEYYGSSWLCTQASTGGNDPPVDWDSTSSYWDLIVATPFVHEGYYNPFRRYNTNQTVLQNGTMWRCMQDDVRDAPPAHPMYGDANWEYIGASGGRWMGAYVSGTQYYQNELVEYNGNSYVCTTTQTVNSPDQSGWELVASKGDQGIQGVDGGGVGAGYLFDTGITNDPSNAEVRFNTSVASSSTKVYVHELDLKGGNSEKLFTDWIAGNTSYVQGYIKITSANDNTRWWGAEITRTAAQGASVHELEIQNISTTLISTFTDEEQVVISLARTGDAGLHWMSEYSASQDYDLDDCVYYEGRAYVCTTAHSAGAGSPQSNGTGHWRILVTGFEWRDNWSSLTTYYKNDIVHYAGNTYLCKLDSVTIQPTNPFSWDLFTSKGTNGQNGSDGADNTTPIGTVLMFAGGTVPDDYLLCDGSSYSISTYSELHGVIGTDYGGSGNNFNLPNLIGRFPLGAAQTTGHDPTVGDSGGESWTNGEIDVTIVKSDLPPHSHDLLTDHTTAFVTPIGVLDWTNSQGNPDYHSSDGTDDSNPFVKESISGVVSQSNLTVTPPFLTLNFIIRYQ